MKELLEILEELIDKETAESIFNLEI